MDSKRSGNENKSRSDPDLFSLFGKKSPLRTLDEYKLDIHNQGFEEPVVASQLSLFGYSKTDIDRIIDCLNRLYLCWEVPYCRDLFDEKEKCVLKEVNKHLDIPASYYITEKTDELTLIQLIRTENEEYRDVCSP